MFCGSSLQTGTWSYLHLFHETRVSFSFCRVALHSVPAQIFANTQLIQRPDACWDQCRELQVRTIHRQPTGRVQVIMEPFLVCCSHNPLCWLSVPSESSNLWEWCRPDFQAGSCKYDGLAKNTSEAYPISASLLRFSCFMVGYMGDLHCGRGERTTTLISSSGSISLITCKLWLRQLVS